MSENKKGPGSSLANSQGTNKSSNKLYHERNEESKMNISTAVSVLKIISKDMMSKLII